MRILFVTPYVPSRIRVRPFHLIKSLAAAHDVSLISLVCDEYERELVREVADCCSSIDLVPLPKWQAYANCLLALPSLLPLRVAYYQSPTFIRRIRQIVRERNIEIVHGELIKVAPTLQAVQPQEHVPVVYDSVDCISSYLRQQWKVAHKFLPKAFIYTEWKKMQRYEPRALATFDRVIITSARDRDHLIQLGELPEHIHVVPNGVDTEYFTPPVAPREADTLVFCAKMDYYPNFQAMLKFCQEVLPRIWEQRPQVRLTIVGNNPPPVVRALSADRRITVTGYVPDIRPYLSKAAIALAPLFVAAGVQNKVLEALAMGAPMVATPYACGSLQIENETHLLIAEEPQAFAEAVLKLLRNSQLAQSLGDTGRYYIEKHHSWADAANTLTDLYSSLVAKQADVDALGAALARK